MSKVSAASLVNRSDLQMDVGVVAMELGPAEMVMTAAVARRYYLAGESKVEIAAALGISRFKVARLLDLAREIGLVRIEIASHGALDTALSAALQEAYDLRHCVVVLSTGTPDAAPQVGTAAAELVAEIVTKDDVLGLPWARTVADVISALPALPRIPVVQLSGSLVVPDQTSPVDLVRRASRLAGGESHMFYAPMLLDDAESTEALMRQPSVAEAMDQIDRITLAIVGIGAWAPRVSTIYDACSPADRSAVAAAGVVGEVAGVFFDAAGRPVETVLGERLVTVQAEQLRGIPEVIGVAYGEAKAAAVRASVLNGLVDSLVVNDTIARFMLEG